MKLITFSIIVLTILVGVISCESNLVADAHPPAAPLSEQTKTSVAASAVTDDLQTAENFFLCLGFACFGAGGGYGGGGYGGKYYRSSGWGYGGYGGWGYGGWRAPVKKGLYFSFNKGGYRGYRNNWGWGRK